MLMRKQQPFLSFLAIASLLLLGPLPAHAQPPAATAEKIPFPIVELHGTPAEMGSQHGKQLAETIKLLDEKYLKVFIGTPTKRFLAIGAARVFEQKILPEHMAEATALAQQSGI